MSQKHDIDRPAEIEILPPEADGGPRVRSRARIWIGGTSGVKVIKVGPIGAALLTLAGAVVLAMGLIFFASAFLVLLPVALVVGAIAYLTGAGGNPFRRIP
ncbi:hypothetical protein [Methylosinus sp. Ce-a6]|uniref:hypothetical protein n=1 Tax=Methylosinus sp. Ce-a6 TaxID=2172005 RepID=UPI00135C859E|nr:hypothetical protein [Methylosinus sp. Ce-a6]